jgi:hypothetical protein
VVVEMPGPRTLRIRFRAQNVKDKWSEIFSAVIP